MRRHTAKALHHERHSRRLARRLHSPHQILCLMDVQVIIKNQKCRLRCRSMERFCSSDTWMDDPPASDLILGRAAICQVSRSDWHSRRRRLLRKQPSGRGFALSLPRRGKPRARFGPTGVFVTSARDVRLQRPAKRYQESCFSEMLQMKGKLWKEVRVQSNWCLLLPPTIFLFGC